MAQARKTRERKFPQADFEIVLADVVAALIDPQEVAIGDRWTFQVVGDALRISRTRDAEELLVPGEPTTPEAAPARVVRAQR